MYINFSYMKLFYLLYLWILIIDIHTRNVYNFSFIFTHRFDYSFIHNILSLSYSDMRREGGRGRRAMGRRGRKRKRTTHGTTVPEVIAPVLTTDPTGVIVPVRSAGPTGVTVPKGVKEMLGTKRMRRIRGTGDLHLQALTGLYECMHMCFHIKVCKFIWKLFHENILQSSTYR